jgi:hypothetical protein
MLGSRAGNVSKNADPDGASHDLLRHLTGIPEIAKLVHFGVPEPV